MLHIHRHSCVVTASDCSVGGCVNTCAVDAYGQCMVHMSSVYNSIFRCYVGCYGLHIYQHLQLNKYVWTQHFVWEMM